MSWCQGHYEYQTITRVQKGEYIKLQFPANINKNKHPRGIRKKMTKVKEQTSTYDCAAGGNQKT